MFLAAVPGCYEWECKGPFETSGAIRHIAIDATGERLYAAAENGGLWVIDDVDEEASSWQPISDHLENLQMRGIAHSVDGKYLFTANALGFVYQSEDAGDTWRRLTDQNFGYIRRLLLYEGLTRIQEERNRLARETRLWIAGQTGLHRIRLINGEVDRIDRLFPTDPAIADADVLDAVHPQTNPDAIFIGVRGQGIWKTPNAEQTPPQWTHSARWADHRDNVSPMIKLAITHNGRTVVGKFGRNVIVNDSAGDPAAWRRAAAVGFGDADRGGSDIGYRGNYSGTTGEWTHAVAVHPKDPKVIAVGQAGLFLSFDGGAVWHNCKSGHEDIQSLVFQPKRNELLLYIASDGGVFRHTMRLSESGSPVPPSGNAQPEDLNTGLATMQFYRVGVQENVAVGNADHQGIRGTTNLDAEFPTWAYATSGNSGYGNNALENNFVSADPKTKGRFFVPFKEGLLRLRYPRSVPRSTEDLLLFSDPTPPLAPFNMRTENNAIFNQLNYPVGTVVIDPRLGSETILASVHEPRSKFAIYLTKEGDADPTGGPRPFECKSNDPPDTACLKADGTATTCGAAGGGTGCYENPVVGTSTWTRTYPEVGDSATPIVSIVFSRRKPGRVYALDEAGQVIAKDEVNDDSERWRSLGQWTVESGDYARQLICGTPHKRLSTIPSPETLFAISHRKLMVSTNSGVDWHRAGERSLASVKRLNSICAHPTRTNVLFLGTDSDVLMSENAGEGWVLISQELPNVPIMHVFTDGGYLYAVTFGRGLWRAKLD